MPQEKKRKPGRKPLTKPALMHQSLEQTESSFTGIEVDQNEFNEPVSKKRKKI